MFLSTCLPQNMKNQATKESHEWKIHQKHVKETLVAKMWKSRLSGSRIICPWNDNFAWKWQRIHSSDYISVAVTTTSYVTHRRGYKGNECVRVLSVCVCVYCVPLPHQSVWSSGLSPTPGSSFQILSGWKNNKHLAKFEWKTVRETVQRAHTLSTSCLCVGRERCQRVCVFFEPHRL